MNLRLKNVLLLKKNILLLILSLVLIFPILGSEKKEKVVGAVQALGGTGAIVPAAINIMEYAKNGISLMAPSALGSMSGLGLGVGLLVTGLEKLWPKKDEVKVKPGQVIVKYINSNGKEVYQKFSGSDVNKFLNNDGFIITWTSRYPIREKVVANWNTANEEVEFLSQQLGVPLFRENPVQINDDGLRAQHAQVIRGNVTNLDTLANEIARKEKLFAVWRHLAILSWATPNHKTDNLSFFINRVSKDIAQLMMAKTAAYTYPYEERLLIAQESLRNEQAAREAAQAEFRNERIERNRITGDYVVAQNNFVAERDVRNRLQIDLNAERAAKAQVDAQLAQVRRAQEASTAHKFELYDELTQAEKDLEAANNQIEQKDAAALDIAFDVAGLEEENHELRQRAFRAQENATAQKFEVYIQAAHVEEENGALRQQLLALQQQLAQLQATAAQAEEKARNKSQKNKALHRQLNALRNPH